MTRRRYPTFEERTAQLNRETERLNATMKTKPPAPETRVSRGPGSGGSGTTSGGGNVPQVRRTDTARDVPMGTGMLGRARSALAGRQRQLDEAEAAATGERRQNYAEGGYVTKAQTTSMPACAKGKKRK